MRSPLFIAVLLAISFACGRIEAQLSPEPEKSQTPINQPINLVLGNIKPLDAVLHIAALYRIPLGIAFGTHPLLCSESRPTTIRAGNFLDALSQAVAGSGYTATHHGDAYILVAPDLTEHERKVLGHRFDRFSATDSTMSDAGQLLAGYIITSIDGKQGFIVSSLIGPPLKTFTIRMQGASTAEIANRIVSQDGKGIWMLRPIPQSTSNAESEPFIQILPYSANLAEVQRVSCEANRNEHR